MSKRKVKKWKSCLCASRPANAINYTWTHDDPRCPEYGKSIVYPDQPTRHPIPIPSNGLDDAISDAPPLSPVAQVMSGVAPLDPQPKMAAVCSCGNQMLLISTLDEDFVPGEAALTGSVPRRTIKQYWACFRCNRSWTSQVSSAADPLGIAQVRS